MVNNQCSTISTYSITTSSHQMSKFAHLTPTVVDSFLKISTVNQYIRDKLLDREVLDDDAFIVLNLAEIQERLEVWKEELPEVELIFAVKAHHDRTVVTLFARQGSGFDVSSLGELATVEAAGVPMNKVVFAQPYKQPSHFDYTLRRDILSVVDSVDEIRKMGEYCARVNLPARTMIRILPDQKEGTVKYNLSVKFGAPLCKLEALMEEALKWPLVSIVGITFHVGSHCESPISYLNTLRLARVWWDRITTEYGVELSILDIGGGYPGYPGQRAAAFRPMARHVRQGLEEHFGDIREQIRVMAEPGRYMVTSAVSVVTQVIGEKGEGVGGVPEFVLNTGVYGALSHTIWDEPAARGSRPYRLELGKQSDLINEQDTVQQNGDVGREMVTRVQHNGDGGKDMVFWGPTLDSIDLLVDGYYVPGIHRGDWLVFPDLGAYVLIMTTFNGFQPPKKYFVCTENYADKVEKLLSCDPSEPEE